MLARWVLFFISENTRSDWEVFNSEEYMGLDCASISISDVEPIEIPTPTNPGHDKPWTRQT
jgi:hypothetical protein